MSQIPPPIYHQYASPPPNEADVSYLKTISILHYVWGGLAIAGSCLGIIYVVLGTMMVKGAMPFPGPVATTAPGAVNSTPPPEFGYMFIGMGSCVMLAGWAIGIMTIISGRRIAARRSRMFSIVIAGINCMSFPLGTLLGVFTIILLSKEPVKRMYGQTPDV